MKPVYPEGTPKNDGKWTRSGTAPWSKSGSAETPIGDMLDRGNAAAAWFQGWPTEMEAVMRSAPHTMGRVQETNAEAEDAAGLLQGLPQGERWVVEQHAMFGMSFRHLAKLSSSAPSTLFDTYQRGLQRLRDMKEELDMAESEKIEGLNAQVLTLEGLSSELFGVIAAIGSMLPNVTFDPDELNDWQSSAVEVALNAAARVGDAIAAVHADLEGWRNG